MFNDDAVLLQGGKGQGNVALAFQFAGNLQGGIPRQERQSKKQAADELAAHISGQGKMAGMERPLDRQRKIVLSASLLEHQPLLAENGFVGFQGTAAQLPGTHKGKRFLAQGSQRNQEPEGGPRFPAVQHRPCLMGPAAFHGKVGPSSCFFLGSDFCPQLPETGTGGQDILAEADPFHLAGASCQGRTDQGPVPHAFGRRHPERP